MEQPVKKAAEEAPAEEKKAAPAAPAASEELDEVAKTVIKAIAFSMKEESFEYVKEGEENPTSKCIGKTVAFNDMANEAYLNVVMTIWIEGWEPLPSPTTSNPDAKSPIWNPSDYIGSMFDVGITFAVQTEQ